MTLARVDFAAQRYGLFVMGALHEGEDTLILLGAGKDMWPLFTASAEYAKAIPDPLDQWSKTLSADLAAQFDAQPLFPSDGPPYAPFIRWARDSGQFFQSPTGMLIHPEAGLMISIRMALRVSGHWPLPATAANPCDSCVARPCLTACPVGALSGGAPYDVPKCKDYLDTAAGADCMTRGCCVRRACPVSQRFDRDPAQSAFHMASFKG